MAKGRRDGGRRPKNANRGGAGTGAQGTSVKTTPEFDPRALDRSVIAIPLFEKMRSADASKPDGLSVIFNVNFEFHAGRDEARREILKHIAEAVLEGGELSAARTRLAERSPLTSKKRIEIFGSHRRVRESGQYVFAKLSPSAIAATVRRDSVVARETANSDSRGQEGPVDSFSRRAIYRVWPDFQLKALLTKSASTIKATAARKAFDASGRGIVWAVVDSGIDGQHIHFEKHKNLSALPPGVAHRDFVDDPDDRHSPARALSDGFGHGTHVAGILAGELSSTPNGKESSDPKKKTHSRPRAFAVTYERSDNESRIAVRRQIDDVAGIAPECKLLSLRVADDNGGGVVSAIIEALQYVNEINGFGRNIRVHGVNISLGYEFEPEWFACGQSPLCVEVNRLVASGVVVVIAAGNSGYGRIRPTVQEETNAGLSLTINDPGNAERAVTVGSTHRDMPHVYGVSYFSSKGPTGDGRRKPDLVAPGEKIVSCGAGIMLDEANTAAEIGVPGRSVARLPRGRRIAAPGVRYVESSGTSAAAPHVSGGIAAFLSLRREFIGQPDRVKQIFMESATDLGREGYFQGRGLLDLMRAIQSV